MDIDTCGERQRRRGRLAAVVAAAFLTACSGPGNSSRPVAPHSPGTAPAEVLAVMERVGNWQLANPAKYRTTDWTQGALYAGMMALDSISPNPRFREAMFRIGTSNQWKLGPWHYNADDHCVGQMYAEMSMRLGNPKLVEPMRAQFDSILAKPSPVQLLDFTRRQAGDRWSWCDALFMAPPAWTRLWSATGDRRYLDYAVSNWWITSEFLYDEQEHLFYRDSIYFNRLEANGKRVFWGRGNGWVLGGIVRVIQDLPADHPDRERFLRQYLQMSEKILKCQQPDGLWRSSLLDPESYPLKETSGSGFYTYALAWGVNERLLDRNRFAPAVRRAWAALVDCVTPEGKLTHVQPIGADPKKFDVDHSDVYGVGAFLLAGSEVYRMEGGRVLHQRTAPPALASLEKAVHPQDAAAPVASEFRRIVDRYREVILRSDPDWSLEKASPGDRARLSGWIESLREDGTWSDIDYGNEDRASWRVSRHLDRTRLLARTLADTNNLLHSHPDLEAVTFRALDHWLSKRFRNPNWWWNQIGVPGVMCDIIVSLDGRLTGTRRAGALEVLGQAGRPRGGQGANTIWIADLALQRGAMTQDAELVEFCSRILADEIKVTREEGIQPDYSFHQHYARLQQFSYGRPYLTTSARLAWQLHGTRWQVPASKTEILADLVLEGNQWMCRGIYTVPSTLDRSVSRPGTLKWADIRATLRQLVDLVPSRRQELETFLARQNGRGEPLVGARVFPRSDFATYHRPSFSFFLKTLSNRTFPTEVGLNSEHLKGALQNCGDHYLMRQGDEYLDLAPVWDWQLLPGITHADGAGGPLRQPFAGAVTDGLSVAAVMDARFGTNDTTRLSARKFWACHGDVVIGLIGGLESIVSDSLVRTGLEQCHLRGPVTLCDASGQTRAFSGSASNLSVRWVHHAGFAYAPLDATVSLGAEAAMGSWKAINNAHSDEVISTPVFLLALEHGASPAGLRSGYVIAAAAAEQASRIFETPSWRVIRNEDLVQAVAFADGTVMAAFHQPGVLEADGMCLGVDKACLILKRASRVWLADPAQTGGLVSVTLDGISRSTTLPADGTSVELQ